MHLRFGAALLDKQQKQLIRLHTLALLKIIFEAAEQHEIQEIKNIFLQGLERFEYYKHDKKISKTSLAYINYLSIYIKYYSTQGACDFFFSKDFSTFVRHTIITNLDNIEEINTKEVAETAAKIRACYADKIIKGGEPAYGLDCFAGCAHPPQYLYEQEDDEFQEEAKEILKLTPTMTKLVDDKYIRNAVIVKLDKLTLEKLETTFSSCEYENATMYFKYIYPLYHLTDLDHECTIRFLASLSHLEIKIALSSSSQPKLFMEKLLRLHQAHTLDNILDILSALRFRSASLDMLYLSDERLHDHGYITAEVIENFLTTIKHPIFQQQYECPNPGNGYQNFILEVCRKREEALLIDALSHPLVQQKNLLKENLTVVPLFYKLIQDPEIFAMFQAGEWTIDDVCSEMTVEDIKKIAAIRKSDLDDLEKQFSSNNKLVKAIKSLKSIREEPSRFILRELKKEYLKSIVNAELIVLNDDLCDLLNANQFDKESLEAMNQITNMALTLSQAFGKHLKIIPLLNNYANFLFKHGEISQALSIANHSNILLKQPAYALEVADCLMSSSQIFTTDPFDRHRVILLLLKDQNRNARANVLKCKSFYVLQQKNIHTTTTENDLANLLQVDSVISFDHIHELTLAMVKNIIHALENNKKLIPHSLIDLYYDTQKLTFYTLEAFHHLIAIMHGLTAEYILDYGKYILDDNGEYLSVLSAKTMVAYEELLLEPRQPDIINTEKFKSISLDSMPIKQLSRVYQSKYGDAYGKLKIDLLDKLSLYMKSLCLLELLGDNRNGNANAEALNLLNMEILNGVLEQYKPEQQLEILVRAFQEIIQNDSLYTELKSFGWQDFAFWATPRTDYKITEINLQHIALLQQKAASILVDNRLLSTKALRPLLTFNLSYFEEEPSKCISYRRQGNGQ